MQDDSAFGEASTLGYTPSGAKIRGGNPMKEMWQKTKDWVSPRLPFFCGAILPILIAMGACIFPFLYLFPTLREWGLLGKLDAEVMRNLILTTAGSITWLFLYRRAKSADQSAQSAEQSAKASEQGVTADRLAHATQQLAHQEVYVRMGGIFSLEQIAEVPEEREKIANILYIFLRKHTKKDSPEAEDITRHLSLITKKTEQSVFLILYRRERLDIEAAIKALARIVSKTTYQIPLNRGHLLLRDFSQTDLRGLQFIGTDLSFFNFMEADLSGTWLAETNLTHTFLSSTNLNNAVFADTNFLDAKDLTQGQIDAANHIKGHPPRNLPDGLKPPPELDPPEKAKPEK